MGISPFVDCLVMCLDCPMWMAWSQSLAKKELSHHDWNTEGIHIHTYHELMELGKYLKILINQFFLFVFWITEGYGIWMYSLEVCWQITIGSDNGMGTIRPGAIIIRTSNDDHASQSVFKITILKPKSSKDLYDQDYLDLTHWGHNKWTPFHRQHFQMDFLEWKCFNSD